MNNFEEMWDFPVRPGVTFLHANRVHPLMQERVQKLTDTLAKDPNIKKLVLFGSSLDFRCNSFSDLDIYIEKTDAEKKVMLPDSLDCETDILSNISKDSRLYHEINRTGLILFSR